MSLTPQRVKEGAMTIRAECISGGFYVTRLVARPEGLGDALLPAQILTLSGCFAALVPEAWSFGAPSDAGAEQLAALQKLGLGVEAHPVLARLAAEGWAREELGWPAVWRSRAAAMAAVEALGPTASELFVVELGVPRTQVAALVEALEQGSGECGLLTCLRAERAVDAAGTLCGWEVLGVEVGGSMHSWLCNYLHDVAAQELGIRPGALGLLTEAEARSVVALIEGGVGAEPGPWFCGALWRAG